MGMPAKRLEGGGFRRGGLGELLYVVLAVQQVVLDLLGDGQHVDVVFAHVLDNLEAADVLEGLQRAEPRYREEKLNGSGRQTLKTQREKKI